MAARPSGQKQRHFWLGTSLRAWVRQGAQPSDVGKTHTHTHTRRMRNMIPIRIDSLAETMGHRIREKRCWGMGTIPPCIRHTRAKVAELLKLQAGLVVTLLLIYINQLVRNLHGVKTAPIEELTVIWPPIKLIPSPDTNNHHISSQVRSPMTSTTPHLLSKPAFQHCMALVLCLPAAKGLIHWKMLSMLNPSLPALTLVT